MNTETIENCLSLLFNKNRIKIPFYVCAANEIKNYIKNTKKFPLMIIQNTDKAGDSGKHWLAWFILSSKSTEYFDSYGNPCLKYKYVEKPVENITKENCLPLQSDTSYLCGAYCVFYLYFRALGYSYEKIINNFTNDKLQNDYKIHTFMKCIPEITQNYHNANYILKQNCQSNTCKYLCLYS